MRTRLTRSAAALALVAACATNEADRTGDADEVRKAGDADILAYEAFTLDNGLEVVLQRDASDPIVAVTTVVHVGSGREEPGRTGFAHFVEHMAFNDSENVPQGANRRDIPAWGGQRNGGTWGDGTIYYEVVPKDAFEKILWIDSDRLGYMIGTVTTDALEAEKQVVKNEKRQRVDNAAYGYTTEVIRGALYPDDHPYSWTTIGSLPDLQAATLEDVRGFYERWYGPNNATLAIVGDIDMEATKERVRYWFGEIERGPDVPDPAPRPVTLSETVSLSFEDDFATLPELRRTYPTVEAYADDEAALDVLADLLAGSKASPLYRSVVIEAGLAPDVFAYHNAMEIAGEFVIGVRAKAGTDLDSVDAAVRAALDDFAAEGVDADDLARIKAETELSLYRSVDTVLGKSRNLATGNEFAGDPAVLMENVAAVRAVTPEAVMRVFRDHVANEPFVATSFVPKGEAALALADASPATVWKEEVREEVASEAVTRGEAAEVERTPTVADRSEPGFGELPLSRTPVFYDLALADGVRLLGTEQAEVPLVRFDVTIDGGTRMDAAGREGELALLARVMEEGSATRDAAEVEHALGILGADLDVFADKEALRITGTALARNLPVVLAIVEEIVTAPRLETEEIERARAAQATAIKGAEANPNAVASRVFTGALYGADTPLGRPAAGTLESVAALTGEDLAARHEALGRYGARIHVAGDVSEAEARVAFAGLADALAGGGEAVPTGAARPDAAPGTVLFVDVPGAKQSVLMIGRLTVPSADPAHTRLGFANEKLGGGIGGDLAQTLRIEKGYTYGAYSYLGEGEAPQPFMVQTSVRANATGASLALIRDMLAAYPEGFDDDAAALTKNKVVKDTARSMESLGAKLGILRDVSANDLPSNVVEAEQAALLAMGTDEFRSLAEAYMAPGDMVWVVVGDGATQGDAVRAFAESLPDGRFVAVDKAGVPLGVAVGAD